MNSKPVKYQRQESRRELARHIADLSQKAHQGREAMRLLAAVVRKFGEPAAGEGTPGRVVTLDAIAQDLPRTAKVSSDLDATSLALTLTYTE